MGKVSELQKVLRVTPDGIWGVKTQAALDALLGRTLIWHYTKASSFADPADLAAFRKCKLAGGTDQECFLVGDNGIGLWGDDVTGAIPACALPPEDIQERWGNLDEGHNKMVEVAAHGLRTTCLLKDRMPYRAHLTNGAGIDLNEAACHALAMIPPILVPAAWRWVT